VPYAHTLAPLVVALKLLCGLDGRQRSALPNALLPPPPGPSWQSWAATVYQHIADPCPYPLSVEQTLHLSPTEQRTYVEHLRKHVFGQAPLAPDLQELQASLDAQTRPQLPPPQQSVPVQRSRLGATAAGAAGSSQPASDHQPAAAVLHADQAADKAAQGGHAASAEPLGAADSPVNDAAGSVMYTSTMNMKAGLAGHPDYLAVLTVVAAFGWVTPLSLHRLVVALERDMMEAEVGQTVQ
jgi:hypothetical protein